MFKFRIHQYIYDILKIKLILFRKCFQRDTNSMLMLNVYGGFDIIIKTFSKKRVNF